MRIDNLNNILNSKLENNGDMVCFLNILCYHYLIIIYILVVPLQKLSMLLLKLSLALQVYWAYYLQKETH